jgi:hypothetical protein
VLYQLSYTPACVFARALNAVFAAAMQEAERNRLLGASSAPRPQSYFVQIEAGSMVNSVISPLSEKSP